MVGGTRKEAKLSEIRIYRQKPGTNDQEIIKVDYAAIKALVDKYGVHFDPKVRDEVVARYKALDLPTYWAGVNTELTAKLDAKGAVTSVTMTYPRDAVRQYLLYGQMFNAGITVK